MTTESKTAVTGAPPVRSSAWFGSLAKDITRCDGAGSGEEGVQYWRDGCEACLRRTAPRPGIVTMMAPPAIIAFECEYLIELNKQIGLGNQERHSNAEPVVNRCLRLISGSCTTTNIATNTRRKTLLSGDYKQIPHFNVDGFPSD